MPLQTLVGTASHVAHGVSISGSDNSTTSTQVLSLRIDGRPVEYRSSALPSVADGDAVAAAGKERAGSLTAYALRNLTTGATYAGGAGARIAIGIVLIVIGVPLTLVVIGLAFIGLGIWLVVSGTRINTAAALLRDVRPGQPPPPPNMA